MVVELLKSPLAGYPLAHLRFLSQARGGLQQYSSLDLAHDHAPAALPASCICEIMRCIEGHELRQRIWSRFCNSGIPYVVHQECSCSLLEGQENLLTRRAYQSSMGRLRAFCIVQYFPKCPADLMGSWPEGGLHCCNASLRGLVRFHDNLRTQGLKQ